MLDIAWDNDAEADRYGIVTVWQSRYCRHPVSANFSDQPSNRSASPDSVMFSTITPGFPTVACRMI